MNTCVLAIAAQNCPKWCLINAVLCYSEHCTNLRRQTNQPTNQQQRFCRNILNIYLTLSSSINSTKCFRVSWFVSFMSVFSTNRKNSASRANSYGLKEIVSFTAGTILFGKVIIMYWTTGRSRFDTRQRRKDFHLTSVSRPALGPPSLLFNGYRGSYSPG
jgi:hypothetical protein